MVGRAEERRRLADVGLTHRLREQWGARFDYGNSRPVDEPATRLFFHLTVTNPGNYSGHDAHARAIESIGISRFPSTGLSYNELVLPGGRLYEGQPLGRRGAHTVNDYQRATCTAPGCPNRGQPLTAPSWNLNVNGRSCGLARNVGDPVTDDDVRAAARWGAAGKLAGLVHRDARWHGHRCCANKLCPGNTGFSRLDDVSDLTVDYVRNGLGPPPEDDMTPDECRTVVREELAKLPDMFLPHDQEGRKPLRLRYLLHNIRDNVAPLADDEASLTALIKALPSADGIADAVAARLGAGQGGQVTKADVQAACQAALAPFRSLLPGE